MGIEVRSARGDVIAALAPLAHQKTWLAVAAERAVSRAMGGSCSMPLAAFATLDGDVLTIDAAWGDPEGVLELVCVRATAPVTDLASATALGTSVAAELRTGVTAKGGSVPLHGESQGTA